MSNSIKPPQTGPSAATTLILALLSIMVLCYALFCVFSGLNAANELTSAYTYEADDETTVSGYVVRDESLLPSQNDGVLDITLAEGERVAVGERVATVYTDSAAMKTEDQLDTLRAQLDQLTYAMGESESPTAGVKLDSSIQSAIFAMQKNLHTRQYTALEGSVSELRSLVIRRDYSSGGESTAELEAQAEALRAQIKTLEAQQQRSARAVTAPSSGLFSAVVDGYEAALTPATLKTMTPSQLSAVSPDSSLTSNVGKLIYGSTWYYAANMNEKEAASYKVGHTVQLRFVKELDRNLTMTIERISDTENGQKLVVFSSDEYLPEVTLLRRQSANLIHESYSGIRVPTEALRVEDGITGVYCLVGMQAMFKPVDVVYQGSGYYLVEPSKREDDTENTSSSRLRVGDSIIITAEELYNGKVIN